jgi:hypothetical protein
VADIRSRLVAGLIVLLLLLTGSVSVYRRLVDTRRRRAFAIEFLSSFQDFMRSDGTDSDKYAWLVSKSVRMQRDLGIYGYLESYHPAFARVVYRNVAVITTLLPDLFTELSNRGLGRWEEAIAKLQQTLQEVLLRYLGVLDEKIAVTYSELRNPFVWFREGVKASLFLPLTLFSWLGLMSVHTLKRIVNSVLAQWISGVVATVGFLSAVITLVTGWTVFVALIQRFLKW